MQDALGEVQSVLVLGGGSDIGRALCVRLARTRCRTVVLAGRPADDMEPVADAVRAAGATTVETVLWDSTDVDSHRKVIDEVLSQMPRTGSFLRAVMRLGVPSTTTTTS